MNAVVLHDRVADDARPDEADVLLQAEAVSRALARLGYRPLPLAFSLDLAAAAAELRRLRPALVFNLVESVEGCGRLIHLAPALLDTLALPYTGCPTEAMFTTSNKLLAKRIMRHAGIPTPSWIDPQSAAGGEEPPLGRYIVKSVWEHASVGLDDSSVFVASSGRDLSDRLARDRDRLGTECFAEAYVDGREFNLSLLAAKHGPEVVAAAEILFLDYPEGRPRVVGYPAKWQADSFEYRNTPRRFEFPPEDCRLVETLNAVALDCWRLFGLRGYARVDFRVDAGGRPWVLEVNANPCLSPDAGFAAALDRRGVPFHEAVRRILDDVGPSPPRPLPRSSGNR